MNETRLVGITSNRVVEIRRECARMADYCSKPIDTGARDVFGEVETIEQRYRSIAACSERINKLAKMTDSEWDEFLESTGQAVHEADHPKHSII